MECTNIRLPIIPVCSSQTGDKFNKRYYLGYKYFTLKKKLPKKRRINLFFLYWIKTWRPSLKKTTLSPYKPKKTNIRLLKAFLEVSLKNPFYWNFKIHNVTNLTTSSFRDKNYNPNHLLSPSNVFMGKWFTGNFINNFLLYTNHYMHSRHGLPFVLHNTGLLLPFQFKFKLEKLKLYLLRKRFYSFLRINEYKMHIFTSRKNKILINKLDKINN
jgi:hypothetical protein